MKKIICILFIVSVGLLKAQSSYKDLPGKWRLGFNIGGIWESSDVKSIPGLGGGFTLEKILNKRSDAFLGFSLGFRYLGGRTYGLNTSATYDLANNKALNGTFNPAVKYDTIPGYFYANHKTFIQEGALELKMNFPSLEKHTGIIFHIWGGIGIGKYKTWIDALDKDGKMYNFSSVKGQPVSQSDLSRIFDNNYETLAQGSGNNGTLAFIPSLGVGLGYRLGRGVAIVFEHKVSFPGTNLLDGIEYPKNCPVTGSKDFYNYTSVGLVFTLYGGHHATQTSTNTTYTNTNTVNTNTFVTNNNNYVPPPVYPPNVVITYPANNFNSSNDYTTVNATVTNIHSSQQINISQNGYQIHHFTFNSNNGTLHFQTFLSEGVNNFVVTATNQAGTASQGVTIIYSPVINNNVVITNSVVPTNTVVVTNTVVPTNTVVATHTVVTTNTVVATGTVTTNPTHTVVPTNTVVATGTVTTNPTHTVVPTNTVVATGTVTTNPTHTVVATTTVVPTSTVQTSSSFGKKPVVTFVSPAVYSSMEPNDNYAISATVLNVSGANQIGVIVNGLTVTQFNYNATTKTVNFSVNLQLGYNTITITGTNTFGADSKSAVINHKPLGKPPKVVISNPASSPYTSTQSNVIVSGFVYNVSSSSEITVTVGDAPSTFNYNISTHAIDVPVYLSFGIAQNVSSTQVNITATNSFGSDMQGMELIYKRVIIGNANTIDTATTNGGNTGGGMGGIHGIHTKPEITVLSPTVDPFYTNTGVISVAANVNFVLDAANVTVSYNGIQVSVSYDINTKHLNFTSPLKPGLNTFVISAVNNFGTSTKSVNISYTPVNVNTNSGGNSGSGATFNHGGWNMGGGIKSGGDANQNSGGNQNTPRNTNTNSTPPENPIKPVNTPIKTPVKTNTDGGGSQGRPTGGGGTQGRPTGGGG